MPKATSQAQKNKGNIPRTTLLMKGGGGGGGGVGGGGVLDRFS